MKTKDEIIKYFSELPEVKRIKELEPYIDSNKLINSKLNEMKDIQKHMINAKEYHQNNQYLVYEEEYIKIKNKIIDLPFVAEYLELLDIINNELANITTDISKELDKIINNKS